MPSIGWLRVTNLHVGQYDQGRLWPNVRDNFYRDLQRLHKKSGPWDLVFVTGDLTRGHASADNRSGQATASTRRAAS